MKKEKFHPHKINFVQELDEDDFDRRIEFTEIIMNRIQQDGNFINRILFFDESTFCLNAFVNRHMFGYQFKFSGILKAVAETYRV